MRYAITNLTATAPHSASERRAQWMNALQRWTHAAPEAVDFVQLREKLLDAGELYDLALAGQRFLASLPSTHPAVTLLVNSRADVAAAAGARGVHLPGGSGELTPVQVRWLFSTARLPRPLISISCHTLPEVSTAREAGADLILWGPVFEKQLSPNSALAGTGLDLLQQAAASAQPLPVFAVGGVTLAHEAACQAAGAAGVAGIRLFHSGQ